MLFGHNSVAAGATGSTTSASNAVLVFGNSVGVVWHPSGQQPSSRASCRPSFLPGPPRGPWPFLQGEDCSSTLRVQ